MTNILAAQSAEMRTKAETMLQQADRLLCESWNERMKSSVPSTLAVTIKLPQWLRGNRP